MTITPEASQAKIFVSYAHQDGAILARLLLQDLTIRGWDVWLDSVRLTGEASLTAEIEEALDRSEVILALLSRGSYFSDTCRAEQLRSLRKGKCVIPLLAEADADRPIHLEAKQYLDFSTATTYELQFPKLVECIQTRSGAVLKSQFRQNVYYGCTAATQLCRKDR